MGLLTIVRAWREPFAVLPPAGPLRRYSVITFIDSLGSGLFLSTSVLFFTRVIHFSVAEVGVGLSIAGGAAFLGAIPMGALGDRFGQRRMWILLTAVHAIAFACYPLVRSFTLFVVVAVVVALADVGISPVRGAYLSSVAGPEIRVRAKAYNQAVYNAGFAIGAACAGVALQFDTKAWYVGLVLADSLSYLVAAVMLLTLPPVARRPGKSASVLRVDVLRDQPYLLVSVLNGLLMTYAAVLTVALPLWIVDRTNAPAWSVGGIMLLNTLLVVIFQVRASRGADTVAGAAVVVRRAGPVLLIACVIFAVSGLFDAAVAVMVLLIGAAVLTVAELFHSAGAWGMSFGLAPKDRQGEYLGAFAMGSRIYDAVGPALVTGVVLGLGPLGWILLGVLFACLALALSRAGTWAQSRSVRKTSPRMSGASR